MDEKTKIWLLAGGVIVANSAIFTAVGWKLAHRKLEKAFAEDLEVEVAKTRAFYNRMAKDEIIKEDGDSTELRTVDEAADALLRYQGKGTPENGEEDTSPSVTVEVDTVNVFTNSQSDFEWDYEEEAKQRDPETPYVIHEDEWSESELEKVQLTYYSGDNTLADEKDEPIPIIDEVVGIENLERFGHGTQDARIVFVRNEKMGVEFEIALHDGKFAEEVLGFQHSDYPMRHPNRRSRDVDE